MDAIRYENWNLAARKEKEERDRQRELAKTEQDQWGDTHLTEYDPNGQWYQNQGHDELAYYYEQSDPAAVTATTEDDGGEEYEQWEEYFDDNGVPYYYNPATGETQWELPMPVLEDTDRDAEEEEEGRSEEGDEATVFNTTYEFVEHVVSEGLGRTIKQRKEQAAAQSQSAALAIDAAASDEGKGAGGGARGAEAPAATAGLDAMLAADRQRFTDQAAANSAQKVLDPFAIFAQGAARHNKKEEAPPPPESPLFDDGAAEGPDARYLRAARDADPNHVSDHLQRLAARLLQYQPGNDFSAPFLNVDLNFQSIRDVGCRVLAAGLKGSTVRRLHLVGNRITDVGVGHLAEGLRANKSLGELYLNENQITDAGMGKLCVALGFLPALHLLNVSCNPVTERGVKELAMLLVQPTCRLRALFLGGTSGMKRPPQLDVGRPEGVKPGAEAAGRRKRPPPPPKIGDAGALCLAAALLAPHGPPLRALGLSRCDLGKKGLQALGVALCFKNDLTYLNLSGNKIGKDAYNFFVKALEVNPRLRELGLAGCHLKKAEVARLRGLLVGGAAGGVKPALSWDQQKQRAREAVDLRAWVIEQGKKLGVVYPKAPDRLEDDAPAFPPAGPPAPPLPGGGLPPLDDGGGGGGEPPRRLVALASRGASAGPGPGPAGPPLLHRAPSSPLGDDVDVPSGAGALLSAPLHEGLPAAEVQGWLAAAARTLEDLERRRKLAAESQDMAEKEASKMQGEENELISEYSKDCQQVAKELKELQLEEDKLRIKINDLEAAAAARAAAARGALDALAAAEALRGGSIAAARDEEGASGAGGGGGGADRARHHELRCAAALEHANLAQDAAAAAAAAALGSPRAAREVVSARAARARAGLRARKGAAEAAARARRKARRETGEDGRAAAAAWVELGKVQEALKARIPEAEQVLKQCKERELWAEFVPVSCGNITVDTELFNAKKAARARGGAAAAAARFAAGLRGELGALRRALGAHAAAHAAKVRAVEDAEARIQAAGPKIYESEVACSQARAALERLPPAAQGQEDGVAAAAARAAAEAAYAEVLVQKAQLMTENKMLETTIKTSLIAQAEYVPKLSELKSKEELLAARYGMAQEDSEERERLAVAAREREQTMAADHAAVLAGPEEEEEDDHPLSRMGSAATLKSRQSKNYIEEMALAAESCADKIVPVLAAGCKAMEATPPGEEEQSTISGLRSVSTKGMSRRQLTRMRQLKAQQAMEAANMSYQQQMEVALAELRVQGQVIKDETRKRKAAQREKNKYLMKARRTPPHKLLDDLDRWGIDSSLLFEEEDIALAWAMEKLSRKKQQPKTIRFDLTTRETHPTAVVSSRKNVGSVSR